MERGVKLLMYLAQWGECESGWASPLNIVERSECFVPQSGTLQNNKTETQTCLGFVVLEASPGFEPGNRGFAVRCLTTWLWRHI